MKETKRIIRRFLAVMLVFAMVFPLMPQVGLEVRAAVSGTLTGLSNEEIGAAYTGTDDGSNSSWSVTGGNSIKGSVIGTDGMCSDSHYNTTLTITNHKSTAAILSFDYAVAQNSGTIRIAGNTVTENGTYSAEIEAGGSMSIDIGSGSTANATTIDITNLFLIADVQATTTFQPAENGSYTVDGMSITAETVKTRQSTTAYTLSAVSADGYKFVGWYSVTKGKYLSSDITASLYFDSNQTVTAVFIEESAPVFEVDGAKFTDLNEANAYASSNGIGKITLISDGTLPEGDYTISSGVTLLIPFDEAQTCYTTAPATTGNVRTAPSVYRKLEMAENASISVDGAISVSAKHYAYSQGGAAGAPDGKYGYIYMNENSSITVNNGGALYVYGFVSGGGTVTAKAGATVYENMQIADFRGGSATMGMYNNAQKIFPINQYFIQNIEVKLTLESGADEYIYTSIYASNMSTSTAVHFIGNEGAMFSVSEGGYFAKEYLSDQDRLEISVAGDAAINSLTLSLSGMSVSSSNYVLPINNAITINVLSGRTEITQDVALLAGSQLNIASDAEVLVTEGSSVYVYDQDEWTQANYASNAKFKRVPYSPTRTYTRTNNDLVDARIDLNGTLTSDGAVYTTAGGADIVSSEGTGKFVLTNGAGTNTATYMYKDYTTDYDTIPITSAKLHNAEQYYETEEEYTCTAETAAGSTYYYDEAEGKWKLEGAAERYTVVFDANGGEGNMESQTFAQGTEAALKKNVFTRDGYQFTGWNTAADGSGTAYTDEAVLSGVTENMTLYAQWQLWNGWFTDENGTGYVKEGEKIIGKWDTIDGNIYYFKDDGYVAKGICEAVSQDGSETALFVFDDATGVFLSGRNGLYDSGADTYWTQGGKVIRDAGLVRVEQESGEIHYYYFGADGKAYKGTEAQDHYLVEKNNGLDLPAGINYVFGTDGVIRHFEDTSINGIYYDEATCNYYYCIDGVIIANGLMFIDGSYYYARTSTGALVTDCSYYVTKTNGLLNEGIYTFDQEGKIVFPDKDKNGIVEENGSLYYYVDGVITGAGLIQIGDDYYYVRTSNGEVVHDRSYWVTATNDLLPSAVYHFDSSGKMIDPPSGETDPEKNGIVEENGSLYYYVDGIITGAGLIQIDGDYYYVRTSTGEVIHGRTYWITATNDLLPSGQYTFADDGKMIIQE